MKNVRKAVRNVLIAAASCGIFASLGASADMVTLGEAGKYTILGLNIPVGSGTGTDVNLSNVSVTGDIGVSKGGKLENMAPSSITGNVYSDPTAVGNVHTSPGTFTGTVFTTAASGVGSVAQANLDALAASTDAASLTPATTTGSIAGDKTFDATLLGHDAFGQTVVDINGNINLNDHNITLTGTASSIFIVNVSGNLALTGTASIVLGGAVTASHVLFNFTGGSTGTFNTHVGDTVFGTYLAPGYDLNLDGSFNGALIGGPVSIGLLSGAKLVGTSNLFNPPEPPAMPLPATAVAGFALLAGFGCVRLARKQSAVLA